MAADAGATLAREAMKPVSSMLDALLAPTVAQLRRWAAERAIQGRLEDPNLPDQFTAYARKLAKRVSAVQTIVFPARPLALPEVYEPLTLMELSRSREVNEEELRKDGLRAYLIDQAGMGKSTFARHLVLEELSEPDRIPIYIELRRVPSSVPLLEAIAREFDEPGKPFDRDLLNRLLTAGRFFIVLDGFDEVSESMRAALAEQIEELAAACEDSTIIVTARPEVPLPVLPNARSLVFNPLSTDKAAALALRYDTVAGLDIGRRLIEEFPRVPERFLTTPLWIALLYRTFGYNGTISTRVSTFYDELYNALYKGHDLTKTAFSRDKSSGLDAEDFRALLRALSFLVVSTQQNTFSTETELVQAIQRAIPVASVRPASSLAFARDLLLSVPLLVREGTELKFVHLTVAEFHAAEFISLSPNGEELISDIRRGPRYPAFLRTLDFISEINPPLFRQTVGVPLAEAALAYRPHNLDARMRTITFDQRVEFGLWPYNESNNKALAEGGNFSGPTFFFYGIYESAEWVCALRWHKPRLLPPSAWQLVTEQIADETGGWRDDLDFSDLDDLVPLRRWAPIERLRRNFSSTSTGIDTVLNYTLAPYSGEARGTDRREARVLTDFAARALLEAVREEREAREWAKSLLG